MKKNIIFLVLAMITLATLSCKKTGGRHDFQEELINRPDTKIELLKPSLLEVSDQNKLRVINNLNWNKTDILVDDGAEKFIDYFPEALNNPGKSIKVSSLEKKRKILPKFKTLVTYEEAWIEYQDGSEKKINYLIEIKRIEGLSALLIPLILALSLMILAIIFKNKRKLSGWLIACAGGFTLLITLESIFGLWSWLSILATIALVANVFAFIYNEAEKKDLHEEKELKATKLASFVNVLILILLMIALWQGCN